MPVGSEPRQRFSPEAMRSLPSLRFLLVRKAPVGKLSAMTPRERRAYLGPGAYRIGVTGHIRDITIYCVSRRDLTESGGAVLVRCPAPAAHDGLALCTVARHGRAAPRSARQILLD